METEIDRKFRKLESAGEGALVLYLTCGYPSVEETIEVAERIIEAGCDILELGLPFSDPIADGPTIQESSQRAIASGMTTDLYFETCSKIRGVPKVSMTYYNLIYQYGLERFAKESKKAGIDALIVPDLPPEESHPLLSACKREKIQLIFIVSPQTTKERLSLVSSNITGGFLYLQSLLGITGAREDLSVQLRNTISKIRSVIPLPIAVGFGISKPEHVREILAQGADGVIIGSALINRIRSIEKLKRVGQVPHRWDNVAEYVESLKEATRERS